MQEQQRPTTNRLHFIDIARSLAILLMLQGHFVDSTLSDEYRSSEYIAFTVWSYIRQFTGAIFLTVTGIIFTYLLMHQDSRPFFQNQRIRKGFKRVLLLFFWGYILQPNAFHVLQCIAVGILLIMAFYGISLWVKRVPSYLFFITASILLFATNLYFGVMKKQEYWPIHAPAFLQNMFHGPNSIFPITPYVGFVMLGAFLGSILHKIDKKIHSIKYILPTFVVGICFIFLSKSFFNWLNHIPEFNPLKLYVMAWISLKIGMVLLFLSLLIALEAYVFKKIKPNLFLKIGQNTLMIFISHIFILYGPWLNLSINKYFGHRIEADYIAPAALMFVLFFIVLVYLLDRYQHKLSFILFPIKEMTNRIFGIKN